METPSPEPLYDYQPRDGYLRIATACPEVAVADVETNLQRIDDLYHKAVQRDVSLVTFPELSVTGYTLGDLVNQNQLLDQAKQGLSLLASATEQQPTAMVVGLPLQVGNRLYNCAAMIADGRVQGIVPKTNLPTYNEFYEDRWYDGWDGPNTSVQIGDSTVPFGTDMLFEVGGTACGIEICEDLWVADSPSIKLAAKGALVIVNPSASPEQVDKASYRNNLVRMQSAKLVGAYAYAGCHTSESTAEIVMGGHQLIYENGHLLAERQPFSDDADLRIADIDIDILQHDRRKQHAASIAGTLLIHTGVERQQVGLIRRIDRNPFLPDESAAERFTRLETTLQIQASGLAARMRATHQNRLVLGLSGGLDSTLALLVAIRAADIMHVQPADMIDTLTMPGPASSEGTQTNAQLLAKLLGVNNQVIPINGMVAAELAALGHDGLTQDITYENAQARARTNLLFNYGNRNHAIVLGTGDLSEIAIGWCTYNADQQSHYNVNASIPKTVVKALVEHAAVQPRFVVAANVLDDILHTIVSPELTTDGSGGISQSTDEVVGPIELREFYLQHLVRSGESPSKIHYLATQAMEGDYSSETIDSWLRSFIRRFAFAQFKRENMPNGPKVGTSLSPRGDWRMPPDLYNTALWQ
ncbi:MAG: NH(3)-dependent synthetase [Candidatus Saccharibacteria bacterium]|nr:NH(3)-dependent synthetase [Candidatus Saccharibacteria bacterium]